MLITQRGLDNVQDKNITTEAFFEVLVGSLYAGDFNKQITNGDMLLVATVYDQLSRAGMDMAALYGQHSLTIKLISQYKKISRKHLSNSDILSVEFVFQNTGRKKEKAITKIVLTFEDESSAIIEGVSLTLARYVLYYIFSLS